MDETMKNDLINLIRAFDGFLDNMYDRGAFDSSFKEDGEIENLVQRMKDKYIPKEN